MIPIRDDNPTFHPCVVTVGLIVVNVLVFLAEISQGDAGMQRMIWKYGFVPAELVQSREELRREMVVNAPYEQVVNPFGRVFTRPQRLPFREVVELPAWINIFTSMFLHGGWLHLLGNMLYLWIFGNNIEERLGPVLFLVFYLATGVAGNLAHTAYEANVFPLVGASGAISGVMGAYILLFPHARVLAIVPLGWYPVSVKLPAWIFLGVYFVFQNLFPAVHGTLIGQTSNVAFLAHIGGFVAGMALIYVLPHRRVPQVTRRFVDQDDDADIVI